VARDDRRRYVAPAAFLLAVTIAVILVRAGMDSGSKRTATRTVTASSTQQVVDTTPSTTTAKTASRPGKKQYWTVKAGDSFGAIASETGVPVATIERLNPNVSSTSLYIGEKIRIK
jgi:LysM repeat protein